MAESPKNINPHFQRKTSKHYHAEECIAGLQNDRKILSYLISKSESSKEEDISFIQKVLSETKSKSSVKRIAVSGSPGVGKSTFINCFGKHLIDKGYKVAILPVDPSSELSRGSILGDKTRMDDLVGQNNAYVKPMASALALGGVAPASMIAQMLCERAGFDYIITETVGVGQSEFEARHLVDCFILLLQPGGGDELQGIKRGIMEMADLILINKADGAIKPEAEKSLREYSSAIHLMLANDYGWNASVLMYSSLTGEYNLQLEKKLEEYFVYMDKTDRLDSLRMQQQNRYVQKEVDKILLQLVNKKTAVSLAKAQLEENLLNNKLNPVTALLEFKEKCKNELK